MKNIIDAYVDLSYGGVDYYHLTLREDGLLNFKRVRDYVHVDRANIKSISMLGSDLKLWIIVEGVLDRLLDNVKRLYTNQYMFLTPMDDGRFTFTHNSGDAEYNHIAISQHYTSYHWLVDYLSESIQDDRDPLRGPASIQFKNAGSISHCRFKIKVNQTYWLELAAIDKHILVGKSAFDKAHNEGLIDVEYYINVLINVKKWQSLL